MASWRRALLTMLITAINIAIKLAQPSAPARLRHMADLRCCRHLRADGRQYLLFQQRDSLRARDRLAACGLAPAAVDERAREHGPRAGAGRGPDRGLSATDQPDPFHCAGACGGLGASGNGPLARLPLLGSNRRDHMVVAGAVVGPPLHLHLAVAAGRDRRTCAGRPIARFLSQYTGIQQPHPGDRARGGAGRLPDLRFRLGNAARLDSRASYHPNRRRAVCNGRRLGSPHSKSRLDLAVCALVLGDDALPSFGQPASVLPDLHSGLRQLFRLSCGACRRSRVARPADGQERSAGARPQGRL